MSTQSLLDPKGPDWFFDYGVPMGVTAIALVAVATYANAVFGPLLSIVATVLVVLAVRTTLHKNDGKKREIKRLQEWMHTNAPPDYAKLVDVLAAGL